MEVLEAVIQRDIKKHKWEGDEETGGWVEVEPFDVYFIVPSPHKGVTARCGNKIQNPVDDPLWERIKLYSTLAENIPSATRVAVEVEGRDGDSYAGVIVKSIMPIVEFS